MKKLLLFVLLGIQGILLGFSASQQSPTLNEPAHLLAGLSHLRFGSFELYRVNPPLVRTFAAAPVVLHRYDANWSGGRKHAGARPVFEMGETFFRDNGQESIWLMTLARWACIPFCLIGGSVCFLWARDLFGVVGGLVACALWCFSPMVLGLGSTIAPDAHASALGLAACYTFWRWLKNPTWTQAIVTGGVLGLAELSKTTMILFYPLWPLIWIVYRLGGAGGAGVRSEESTWMSVRQWGREAWSRPSYLRGRFQEKGWWYYYAYAILIKSPLGTLGLIAFSIVVCFTRFRPPIRWNDAMMLLAPPLVIFVVASMKYDFSHHSRYILPCLPFVFVWLGQFGRSMEQAWSWGWEVDWQTKQFYTRGGVSLGVLSALLLTWSVESSLSVYPHSLSHFNELAGGPKNGPSHLLHSNIDWGQDLLFLEKWIEKNADGEPVYTAFYNFYNPFDLEITGIEPWPFREQGESQGVDVVYTQV